MTRTSKLGLCRFVTVCLCPAVVAACLGCRSYPTTGPDLGAWTADRSASMTGLETGKSTKAADSVGKSSDESSLSSERIVLASSEQSSNHASENTARKEADAATQSGASQQAFPIDLPTALRLAGANNLQIQFAQHRVSESLARLDGAEVL